jgi:hypothetical protein
MLTASLGRTDCVDPSDIYRQYVVERDWSRDSHCEQRDRLKPRQSNASVRQRVDRIAAFPRT